MRTTLNILLLFVCLSVWPDTSPAQESEGGLSAGRNGLTVFFKTRSSSSNALLQPNGAVFFSEQKGNETRVHRIISDRVNKIYFGYDVVVERVGGDRFNVSIKPLSATPPEPLGLRDLAAMTLPKYPASLAVDEGDAIALDVLTNSKTGEKITDYITIKPSPKNVETPGAAAERHALATARASGGQDPGSFHTDAIQLKLTAPKLFVNGRPSDISGADWGGIIQGPILSVYVPGKARFVFSLFPRSEGDFKEIAILDQNKLGFKYGNDNFELVSGEPVLAAGGSWKVWMLADEDYRPDPTIFGARTSAQQMAGEYIEYGAANQYSPVARTARRRPSTQTPFYLRWIEDDVLHIITEEEKAAFLGLATDAQREAFIESFWQRRDTDASTPDNEFRREYYARLARANAKFGVDGKKGSATDRGRIYMQKGIPATVIHPGNREIWTYADGERFEFFDASGNGDFKLVSN